MQGYGLWSGPTDQRMNPRVLNFSRALFMRDLMVANGDADKSIWISEMNWNAVPDEIVDKRFGQVTEEQQARYLPMAYQRIQEEWPWLGVANTWYFKRPDYQWRDEQKPEYYFRLVEPDLTPLPVYESIKGYANTVNSAPVMYPGVHPPDHWAIASNDYTLEPNAQASTGQIGILPADGRLSLHLFGVSLRIHPPEDAPDPTIVSVSIDGAAPETYEAEAGQVLRIPLKSGEHQLTLVAEGSLAVDRWTVRDEGSSKYFWPLLCGFSMLLVLFWLALLVFWLRRTSPNGKSHQR
jgi:hypothetical protein